MNDIKPIKIIEINAAKIREALGKANGKSKSHVFYLFEEIKTLAIEAETGLENLGLKKASRVGAHFHATSGGKMPSSYKYRMNVTKVILERKSTGWALAKIGVVPVFEGGQRTLVLNPAQEQEAISATRKKFFVA